MGSDPQHHTDTMLRQSARQWQQALHSPRMDPSSHLPVHSSANASRLWALFGESMT